MTTGCKIEDECDLSHGDVMVRVGTAGRVLERSVGI